MNKIFCWILFLFLLPTNLWAQSAKQRWVDSVYSSLNEQEKIGQLFMVAAYSGGEKYNQPLIQNLINNRQIGGVIFMQGTPEAQAQQTNIYQKSSQVPLLIGMDAEWGLGMRLTGVNNLPRQMMLGATRSPELMTLMANVIAYQCKRLGVHVDFAPVIDVNNNPNNPVINFRSFGEDKNLVTEMGKAYVKGLQENGVMACVKHFPGHGDVDIDSHLDLPVIKKSKKDLKELELYPFQQLFDFGAKSTMIAHLSIPALDNRKNRPSTLSKAIVTDLLQNEMGFQGLIFTDALNMKGVAKYFEVGAVDLEAFLAGNDVLLFSQDVPKAIQKIQAAIKSNLINEDRLAYSVKKILAAKFDAGLNKFKTIEVNNATSDLNQFTERLFDDIAKSALTLVKDDNKILKVLKYNNKSKIAYLNISAKGNLNNDVAFIGNQLKIDFSDIKLLNFGKNQSINNLNEMMQQLKKYDIVLVGMHDLSLYPNNNYGFDAVQLEILRQLSRHEKVMFINYGNAYALKYICDAASIIETYEENESTYKAVRALLNNTLEPNGKLPVTACVSSLTSKVNSDVRVENGMVITQNTSQNYSPSPVDKKDTKDADLSKDAKIENVDPVPSSLIKNEMAIVELDRYLVSAIAQGVFPGCQVYAMKNGKMIYRRSYGTFGYGQGSASVDHNTLFDIASVTKITATTLAVMKLYEEKKLNIYADLGTYLPFVRGTDKAGLKINDILLHQAGLKAWIPFYKSTLDSLGKPQAAIYHAQADKTFDIPVARNMFMNKSYEDTVWQTILNSPLSGKQYVYSDLDFMFLQKVVEQITGKSLDAYVAETFYQPMGLKNTLFNPWKHKLQGRCAPSEQDDYFRYQLVQGYVHDMGAAMLGGVAGHAGLFSNAEDIAHIMQMLLDHGRYKGKQYLKPETIDFFTSYHSFSRRGIGFDKPEKANGVGGPAADICSKATFGHQGFTGTCAWADPQTGIVFVFLSNRTNPTANNKKINQLNIRTNAQAFIYKACGFK
ncbi:MAG TPA: glycoside hydrolase family 3 N-terminal domain-containing protein [Edaphocola sp.]|nr:glycoside hydrolase family 3 N-terminal domain-containing protein [Edaphocola sp.]